MDVAKAVLDARHDIALQTTAALLTPDFVFVRSNHRIVSLHPRSGDRRFVEPLLEIRGLEGLDHLIQVAFHETVEIVES
jgi:hypothetical protein